MSYLAQEIRRLVSDYVAGQVPFDRFAAAVTVGTWDVDQLADPEAHDLAYAVELAVAEFTSGHRTDANLRAELAQILGNALEVRVASEPLVSFWVQGTIRAFQGFSCPTVRPAQLQGRSSDETRCVAAPA